MEETHNPIKIIIDGNIGAGKSTILKAVLNRLPKEMCDKIDIFDEPVDKWMQLKGEDSDKSFFEQFYEDQERNVLAFELLVLLSNVVQPDKTKKIFLKERDHTSNLIFSNFYRSIGKFKEFDYKMFNQTYDILQQYVFKREFAAEKVIYIRTSPKECLKRVRQRNRPGEEDIDLNFLKQLNTFYEKHYNNGHSCIIDNNSTNMDDAVERIVGFITRFF